jgi:hypothetical protein
LGNLKRRDKMREKDVNELIILKCMLIKVFSKTGWLQLANARNKWRGLVNTVINLRLPQKMGKFFKGSVTLSVI